MDPELPNIFWVHPSHFKKHTHHERDQEQSQEMGYEVMITEFDIFQIDALEEIREYTRWTDLDSHSIGVMIVGLA
jgi:hypothetical protein